MKESVELNFKITLDFSLGIMTLLEKMSALLLVHFIVFQFKCFKTQPNKEKSESIGFFSCIQLAYWFIDQDAEVLS